MLDYRSASGSGASSHVVMFVRWANDAHTQYVIDEEAGSLGAVERTVPYPYDASMDGTSSWVPFRYDNIVGDPQRDLLAADVSGDGYADLMGVKSDGTLWEWPDNFTSNPGHLPYASGSQIGTGFSGFSDLTAGYVSGDTYADLLGVRTSDGTLWEWPNNTNTNPGHVPYTSGVQIGTGFGGFADLIAADASGDGYADLLGVKSDGSLWEWADNFRTNPDHKPYTTGVQIGSGFSAFSNFRRPT